jgi:hypothetical protein
MAEWHLSQALSDEANGTPNYAVFPAHFERTDELFWHRLIDYAVRWETDENLIERLITRALSTAKVTHPDSEGGSNTEWFIWKTLEGIYRLDTSSYNRERGYLTMRRRMTTACIVPRLLQEPPHIYTARTLISGIARDHFHLGYKTDTLTALGQAEKILQSIPPTESNSKSLDDTWNMLYWEKTYVSACVDTPIDELKTYLQDIPDKYFYNKQMSRALMIAGEGRAAMYLIGHIVKKHQDEKKEIPQEELIDLLKLAVVQGNKKIRAFSSAKLAKILHDKLSEQLGLKINGKEQRMSVLRKLSTEYSNLT